MSYRDLLSMAFAELIGCGLFIFTGIGAVVSAQKALLYAKFLSNYYLLLEHSSSHIPTRLLSGSHGGDFISNTSSIALSFGFTISWVVHAVSHVKGG